MKNFLKFLATAAAVAAVVPFHAEGDKHSGEIKGLLWKASWKIDPEHKTQSDINVLIGFNNPFDHLKKNDEDELFADDLVVDYCCDETLARETVHSDKSADVADDNETETDDDCSCNDETCGEE